MTQGKIKRYICVTASHFNCYLTFSAIQKENAKNTTIRSIIGYNHTIFFHGKSPLLSHSSPPFILCCLLGINSNYITDPKQEVNVFFNIAETKN